MGKVFNRVIVMGLIILVMASCQDSQKEHREEINNMMEEVSSAFEKDELSDSLALEAANLHTEYIDQYPDDTANNPRYYYKAVQLLTDAEKYDRSLQLIDTFLQKYPEHQLNPYMLHFKAYYIYEQGLQNYRKARQIYLEFLDQYPEHPELTDAVLFSLEHLGKPDDQLLDDILKKRKEQDENEDGLQ